jgi:uncharacterized protein
MSPHATERLAQSRDAGIRALLAFHKHVVSPVMHAAAGTPVACRFQPTCSEYAAIAIAEHGSLRGTIMAIGRLLRCHPLHRDGFDPVPAKRSVTATTIRAGQSS